MVIKKTTPDDFNNSSSANKQLLENHFKQTLRVIKKISKDFQSYSLSNQNKEHFNLIQMQLFLLQDYYRNGIYENKETIIETNGEGEIDWDKTINETKPIIKNKKPYYIEIQTINTRSNELDYFKLLHQSILNECSKSLKETGLLEYLGMIPCEFSSLPLSNFGDVNYIIYRLQQEIRIQFITKKRNQLIAILTYIKESELHEASNNLKLFGSFHFEHIWEIVCKAVFDDLFNNKFRIQNQTLKASPTIDKLVSYNLLRNDTEPDRTKSNYTLKDLIEKVEWNMNGISCMPDGNLTPDLICIYDKVKFFILDAKYYILEVNTESKQINHNPGIQDILKQFAYERAYSDFLKDYLFTHTLNAFIMPSKFTNWQDEKKAITYHKGTVNYKLMQNTSYEKLGAIQVLEANPSFLFNKYLLEEICLKDLTESVYEILNPINRRINSDKQDYGFILVGHLRHDYYSQIKNKSNCTFYFYDKDKYQTITMHPEIMNCSTFIGYDFDHNEGTIIKGTVIPSIKKLTGKELRKKLEAEGFSKETEDMPSYYCIDIEKSSCINYSNAQFDKLKTNMQDYRGNFLLDNYSPKVIEHE